MEDLNDGLRAILAGTLDLSSLPQMPSKVIRVYLSSTLTDMLQEKRKLIEDVFPELRTYCRQQYGAEFQVIDLRWGQKNEWPDESESRELYWQEILECQNTSAGPTFVTLLGQRYGHTPLPSTILEDDFSAILNALYQHRSRETRDAALLEKWYIKDWNCMPPVFRLRAISAENLSKDSEATKSTNDTEWSEVKARLRSLLEYGLELAFGSENPQRKSQYLMSDLEREIRLGLMHSVDPANECLAFLRTIVDLKNYISYQTCHKFLEVRRDSKAPKNVVSCCNTSEKQIEFLKQDIVQHWLPKENCAEFEVLWKFDEGIERNLHKEYLDDFTNKFFKMMRDKIDKNSDVYNATPLPPMMEEVFQHWHVTQEQCSTFCRQVHDDVIERIRHYVTGSSHVPMVVVGIEGSGKTAIMAQAAAEAADWFTTECLVMVRFVGKTTLSQDALQLVTSISLQITCLLGMPPGQVPKTWKDLQAYFLSLIARIPKDVQLVIFLDGLDQLDSQYDGHSLTWLPKQLLANVKVVLSINPGATETMETVMNDFVLDSESRVDIGPLGAHNCWAMVEFWLDRDNKMIQPEQMNIVKDTFVECSVPMYAKILYQKIKNWTSDMDMTEIKFPTTVYDSIMTLFVMLEQKHGKCFTGHSLSYLTASSTGLSDCEMEDILSIDDDVLDEVFDASYSVIRRIPASKWLRLKSDLRPYINKVRCADITVYNWSHAIFARLVNQRYMNDNQAKAEIHSTMADYFLGIWSMGPKTYVIRTDDKITEIQANRYVSSQPMVFSTDLENLTYNNRKFDQVPRQLSLSGRLEEFNEHVLFNYEWLYSKAKALSTEHVIKDFGLNPGVEANLLEKALKDALPYLSNDVNTMAAEISGRLLSYYDTHPNIRKLIQDCDLLGLKQCALIPNFQCHQVPGSPRMFNLNCNGVPESLVLAGQTSRYLLTKNSTRPYVQIFDLKSGHQVADVLTSAGRIMATPSGNHCLIVDDDTRKAIKMHDSGTGQFLGQFIPLTHIQLDPKDKYELQKIALCETHMCAIVTAATSHLCIAEFATFRFSEVKELDGKASICEITPDERYVFCNAGETLLSYDLMTMEKVCDVNIETRPKQIIFRANMLRSFVINDQENKIYVIHLIDGKKEMMYKVVLTDYFPCDQLSNISLSRDQELLLVRGKDNLVVYHVSTERVVCHITRPRGIPDEFKLPNSKKKAIHFTNAVFSADGKFVIGSIFRTIYIWLSGNGKLLTTLQAPVGIIRDLLVPVDRGQLVSHMEDSDLIQVWSLGDAISHARDLDKLTAPVEEIKFCQSGKEAYVRCKDSDEVGVLNLVTGLLQDLLTHPSAVVSFSATRDGSHMFVASAPSKHLKNLNKIWSLTERKLICEFGAAPAFNTALHNSNAIISIEQDSLTFKAPYNICIFKFDDDTFDQLRIEEKVNFVLSDPFVTPNDKYLVLLTADDYEASSDNHINPTVCAVSMKDTTISLYSAKDLQDIVRISRMLHVRPVGSNPYNVIVLFTNEPDIVDIDDHRRTTGYNYCFGFLILDLCSGVVCQVLEDFMTPGTPLDQVIFSKDVSFCIDNESNMFNMATGFYLKRIQKGTDVPRILLRGGKAVLYTEKTCVYVIRIADCSKIACLDLHETITSVAVGPDDRTIVIGCQSGALVSYVLIDEKYDDPRKILFSLESRNQTNKSVSPSKKKRSWDRIQTNGLHSDTRPTSTVTIGPTDRQYLKDVRPASRFRPTSDTILYLNSSSRSCSMM